ncbi:MAG: hypothetical protein ACOC5T_07090 [Elusimicrobiota bacterium]
MNDIENFIKQHPDYRKDLKKIIKWEKENKKEMDEQNKRSQENDTMEIAGWEWNDVKVQPSRIQQLLIADIVKQVYNSRSSSIYRLEDLDQIEEIINRPVKDEEPESNEFLSDIAVTEEDIKEFKEILKENDGVDYFTDYICPKIVEVEKQKRAILVALASCWDQHDDRFRIHVLMYGEESSGTAKTPLLRFIKKLGGGYTGMRSTRSGLTVNLKTGEKGFLPRHHKNVTAFDEMDKMEKHDRDGILHSMEEGVMPFEAGDVSGEHPAQTIVIAGANSIDCFTPEQLKRFDFTFNLKGYSVSQAQNIAHEISMSMGKPSEDKVEKLKKFLKWTRGITPKITDETRKKGAELIDQYIEYSSNTDIRHIMSIWRVSRSLARLNYHETVEIGDVKRAIKLLNNKEKKK